MIDLKELEKEIDTLLDSETTDSLTIWYNSQSNFNLDCYLGDGQIINVYENDKFSIVENNPHKSKILIQPDNNNVGISQYEMAA